MEVIKIQTILTDWVQVSKETLEIIESQINTTSTGHNLIGVDVEYFSVQIEDMPETDRKKYERIIKSLSEHATEIVFYTT